MIRMIKLNPEKLTFNIGNGEMIEVDRPQSIPFNILGNCGKLKAVGYTNGILACIFCDDNGKPTNYINYFKYVPILMVRKLINNNTDVAKKFVEMAIEGNFPTYVEENPNYFI